MKLKIGNQVVNSEQIGYFLNQGDGDVEAFTPDGSSFSLVIDWNELVRVLVATNHWLVIQDYLLNANFIQSMEIDPQSETLHIAIPHDTLDLEVPVSSAKIALEKFATGVTTLKELTQDEVVPQASVVTEEKKNDLMLVKVLAFSIVVIVAIFYFF